MRQVASRWGLALAVLASLALLLTILPSSAAKADPTTAPPLAPTISQRPTMAIVSWPGVEGVTGYAVEIDTDATFVTARRVLTEDTISVLTGLVPESGYFLRVATWDPATDALGAWGGTQSFSTGPRQYALLAPQVSTDSETSTSVTASWTSVGKDLTYEVALGKQPDDLSEVKPVDGLSATFTKLKEVTRYYLSVRALDSAGNAVTAWSDPVDEKTAAHLPLRVGSYNILCENCSGGMAKWSTRRGPMVATIVGQDLDVLGVQEASIGGIPGGGTQYMDLIRRLGSPYKLTEYRRGASPDVRTIYNSDRLKLIKQGTIALPRGASKRFLGWAIFEQKSTGKRFFFSNTHLEPNDGRKGWTARKRQANAIVAATARLRDGLPVIAVGDYASTKWEKWGNAPYDVMQRAGYLDPLGNDYRSHNSAPGAFVEKRINTSYASLNMYKRKARNFPGDVNGSNTDYIFMTKMRVSEYEVVVRVDSAGRFIGVIPSDHNLIRATAYLP